MSMKTSYILGYEVDATKPYSELSKTSLLFALIKTTAASVFRPIVMFF